jgi:F0F1-type ATP synthase membrane subunit b/b'
VRRRIVWLFLYAALVAAAGSNYARADELTPEEKAELDRVGRWKIINFSIFAIGLGYALVKYSPRFFNARSADIQKAIQDATGLKLEADYRYSEIDRKMAALAEAVKKMRDEASAEMQREHERVLQQTQEEIAHINHNVAAETEAFEKEGADRVRRHTAQLALKEAERRLQDRFAHGEPPGSLQEFIHLVEQGKN